MPLFPAEETALYAAQLADACGSTGELEDEAPLIQLLEHCSAALAAGVAALAAPRQRVAAGAAAGAIAKGTAHAEVTPAASSRSRRASAAAWQRSNTAAQQRKTPASTSQDAAPRAVSGGNQSQPSQPPACEQQLGPKWESAWAAPVTVALRVRQGCLQLMMYTKVCSHAGESRLALSTAFPLLLCMLAQPFTLCFQCEPMHGVVHTVQALAQAYLGPMDERHFAKPDTERVHRQLSAAAAIAYAAGVEALLSHEAALLRNVRSRCTLVAHCKAWMHWLDMCSCLHLCRDASPPLAVLPFSVLYLCMPGSQHCHHMHLYSCRKRLFQKVAGPWPDVVLQECCAPV